MFSTLGDNEYFSHSPLIHIQQMQNVVDATFWLSLVYLPVAVALGCTLINSHLPELLGLSLSEISRLVR